MSSEGVLLSTKSQDEFGRSPIINKESKRPKQEQQMLARLHVLKIINKIENRGGGMRAGYGKLVIQLEWP